MSESRVPQGTHTVRWEDWSRLVEAKDKLGGLDFIHAIIEGRLPHPPFYEVLGFRVEEAEAGRVVMSGRPGEFLVHPGGGVHGSFSAALIESATGLAVWSRLPAGRGMTTLDIKVNYVRAMTTATPPVRCEAKVIHPGNRVATAEARVTDAAGKLYAHGLSTCMVFA
ncbi:MAG: PaaI family thioesterase [Proteobacteria bacterium]|nr:PaaI family thioesterase [Pseudomonadota bacterium]